VVEGAVDAGIDVRVPGPDAERPAGRVSPSGLARAIPPPPHSSRTRETKESVNPAIENGSPWIAAMGGAR
jgi:hypothetical protein